MKSFLPFLAACVAVCVIAPALRAAEDYQPGPDSKPQEGVPKGDILKFPFAGSKIFPGTTRECSVYIPKQYDPAKPACLFVDQDGVQFNAPTVFDNLIAKGELPVIIGVFVTPGRVKAPNDQALDRFNRSLEYDGLGSDYVRFLLEELLPDVEKKQAPDGRPIHLSKKAGDRAIGGSSSGAIAAFTAAWERPDAFSRVFSSIGAYVDLRGGNVYPSLVRKYEPKPLRIFLQDGSADQNIYGGDWWMANQELERALIFAGYEVNHAWGDGGHNGKQATAIFPDAMRWLWKDWPQAPKAGVSKNSLLGHILIPGEEWQIAAEGIRVNGGLAANSAGEVFFADGQSPAIRKINSEGKVSEFVADSRLATIQAFGPDGRLYVVPGREEVEISAEKDKILAYPATGGAPVEIASGFRSTALVVRHDGFLYACNSSWIQSEIWLVKPDGSKQTIDDGNTELASAIALSPDQTLLYICHPGSKWVYSYQIQPDGKVADKQPYYWLHEADAVEGSGASGMQVDREGNLYVATDLGIQVCDQAGRVNCIIPSPASRGAALTFGGAAFDTIYVAGGDKIYKRKVQTKGAPAWQEPLEPAAPHL